MFLIYGKRKVRIKSYTEHSRACYHCKALDLSVAVYRSYFHIFYIPCAPSGPKDAKIYCSNCGAPMMPPDLQQKYENLTKTPFYFYIIPILAGLLVLSGVFVSLQGSKDREQYLASPEVGDIYSVKKSQAGNDLYYFMKVKRVSGDTLFVIQNTMYYNNLPWKLPADDFFESKSELYFLKKEIAQMYRENEIVSIKRDYDQESGFFKEQ